jgi:hypothetical protein
MDSLGSDDEEYDPFNRDFVLGSTATGRAEAQCEVCRIFGFSDVINIFAPTGGN